MFKKAWLVLLALALAALLLAGCGGGKTSSDNPEDAVKAFWDAFAKADFEKAAQYVIADQQDEVRSIKEEMQGDEMFDEEMLLQLLGSFSVKTTGHEINGDTATVDAILSLPDMEKIFGELFSLYFELIADESLDEAALEQKVAESFKGLLNEVGSMEMEVTFELVREDGKWKLSEMPDLDEF